MNDKNEDIDMKKIFKMPSKIKSYRIEKELYTLSNGHVCLGINTNINEKVLIKIYDKEIINYRLQELTLINNEIHMMKLINHRNALKLYEIIESPSYIFLIMEYFYGNKLIDYMNRKKKLSMEDALYIYNQIISLLLYIHDMNLGHLNLNYNNIVVDNSNNIKICEFKYSIFYSPNKRETINITGDKSFLAPELYSKKSCLPELADIWASGVLLYFMTVGELPFYHQNELDLQKLILKGEYKLPSNMDTNLQKYIKAVFEGEENSRYNLTTIFNSDLFKQNKINKNNLQSGLNILSVKYPIDERVMNVLEDQFDLDIEEVKKRLNKNIFDPFTSLYKQIISKFINKDISSNADLISKKYNSYVNNKKNYLDEKLQKTNIKNNINKELEYKAKNKDKESEISKNLQKVLIGLDELLKRYSDPEKKKQRESKSVEMSRKRTMRKDDNKENEKKINRDNKKKTTLKKSNKQVKNNIDKRVNITNISKGRRMSSNIDIDQQMKEDFEKLRKFQLNQNRKRTKTIRKNIIKKNGEIIEEKKAETKEEIKEETKGDKEEEKDEEDFFMKRRRNQSVRVKKKVPKIIEESDHNSPTDSKRNSIEKREKQIKFAVNKNKTTNLKNDNIENIDNNIENSNKNKDTSALKSNKQIKPQKSKKSQKDKNKEDYYGTLLTRSMFPISQFAMMNITRDEFFSQIKGVKLKKMVPNKYYNPDEIRKKDSKKKENPIELPSFNVKNVQQMIENKLKNQNQRGLTEKKDLKNYTYQPDYQPIISSKDEKKNHNDLKYLRNQMDLKYNNPEGGIKSGSTNRKRRNEPRKSVNLQQIENNIVLKSKAGDFRDGDIKKVKTIRFKNKNPNDDIILEEDGKTETPKKLKKKNEKKKINKLKEEKKTNVTFQEDTKRKKKEKEEEEQEKRNKKEREEKRRREEEERKRKEEEEEKKRKEKEEEEERIRQEEERIRQEEERIKREEEEKRRLRKAESEKRRLEEDEENRKRLEAYDNRQKEEREKKKKRENLKKQKEEEMRLKREKEAKERRNKLKANQPPKIVVKKPVSESESDSEESLKKLKKKSKTDRNKLQKVKDKKKFNYHANPLEIYKKNTMESDEESSIEIEKSIKKKKNTEQTRNKKAQIVTMNDFNKFTATNRNESDSESYESSDKEEVKNKNKNKKNNALNKSVENRNKSTMFDKYTNYFFDDKEIKEGILRKKNKDKENAEKNLKKGFYHYQNNPTKVEKRVVDKKFEVRMKNLDANGTLKQSKTTASDNKKKINKENTKKVKIISDLNDEIINIDDYQNDNQIINSTIKRSRNNKNNSIEKRKNNTIVYTHKIANSEIGNQNRSKDKINFNKNNTGLKKSIKKVNFAHQNNKIVENLKNDFNQSMKDYSKFNTINNMKSGNTKTVLYNNNKYEENSKSNVRSSENKKKPKNIYNTERNVKNTKKMIHFKTEMDGRNKNKISQKNKSKKSIKANKH